MTRWDILQTIRKYLFDKNTTIFSDNELYQIMDKAAKQYCADTKIYKRHSDFVPAGDGTFLYPEDYICFESGYNESGVEVSITCSHDLAEKVPNYSIVTGEARFIYDDTSTDRYFRMCPTPESSVVKYYLTTDYGVTENDFGVEIYGESYGCPYEVFTYNYVGDFQYVCDVAAEKIFDSMAIVYLSLSYAYLVDTEFSNPDLSNFYLGQYNGRVAKFNQIKTKNNGYNNVSIFY